MRWSIYRTLSSKACRRNRNGFLIQFFDISLIFRRGWQGAWGRGEESNRGVVQPLFKVVIVVDGELGSTNVTRRTVNLDHLRIHGIICAIVKVGRIARIDLV